MTKSRDISRHFECLYPYIYIASVVLFLAETNTTSARGSSSTWLNRRTDSHRVQYNGCESWHRQAVQKSVQHTNIFRILFLWWFQFVLIHISLNWCEILHLLCALAGWTLWRFLQLVTVFKTYEFLEYWPLVWEMKVHSTYWNRFKTIWEVRIECTKLSTIYVYWRKSFPLYQS